jgi:Fur family peroxide stress response transcriptional regulator
VLESDDHPSAEIIYEEVRQSHPTLSLSTVYNTMHLLKEMNIVKELSFHYRVRYDSNVKLHVNLVCESCGKTIDMDDPNLEELHRGISERKGFTVARYRLDVYGLCRDCLKNGD